MDEIEKASSGQGPMRYIDIFQRFGVRKIPNR
jgi:hypothetical protein